MKGLFLFFLSLCFVPSAFAWDVCIQNKFEYNGVFSGGEFSINQDIKDSWGNPRIGNIVLTNSDESVDFRLKQGWAWQRGTNGQCPWQKYEEGVSFNPDIVQDDEAIIALVAHAITEHGAEFCLTQISASSGESDFDVLFTLPDEPKLQCAWFCEPGWDGYGCQTNTNNKVGNYACNNTNYETEFSKLKNASDPCVGTDSIRDHNQCNNTSSSASPVAEHIVVFDYAAPKYDGATRGHVIVLGAIEFMEHGIKAQPVLVSSMGTHKAPTFLKSAPITSSLSKVLCAQGYTRTNGSRKCEMSSNMCGTSAWCDVAWKNSYDETVQQKYLTNENCYQARCKDPNKVYWGSVRGKCNETCNTVRKNICRNSQKSNFNNCIECSVGQYADVDSCSCKTVSRTLSASELENGISPGGSGCWYLSGQDYINCVLGTSGGSAE